MNHFRVCVLFVLAIAIIACRNHKNQTRVVIYTRAPLKSIVLVEQVGYFDDKNIILDTAIVTNNHDSLVFEIPKTEERILKITLKDNNHLPITIINDSKLIRIHADYFADTCNIQGSAATTSLKKITESQFKTSKILKAYALTIDSIKKGGVSGPQLVNVTRLFNEQLGVFFTNYKTYADTVKSPAAFMQVFNTVDFGPDYRALKQFILSNAKRFPGYAPIKELKKKTLASIRIYEEDLKVGDNMPAITLLDKNGLPYSTANLSGQYYLMDIWSTWCQDCYAFKNAEYHLYKANPAIPVQFVSVAVDDHVAEWKKSIKQFMHPSIELIDTKMWQGPTVQALLFDSIPYNFLVNPRGKIVAKAIKPGDLKKVIESLPKN